MKRRFFYCVTSSKNLQFEKQKTHPRKWDGSSLVAYPDEISNDLLSDFDKFLGFFENKKIFSKKD